MADIFISYAREDEGRIRELVLALEKHGWSIFWDRRIPAGKSWQTYIGQALSDAKCVIVAWSHHSIISDWVIEEANDGKKRGLLIPVFLDSVEPPLGFRGIQAADLTDWKPGHASINFDQLIQDITGVIGGKLPRPAREGLVTPRTETVATPKAIPTELPPHKPAPAKVKPPRAQPREPERHEAAQKRSNLLIGAVIAVAIAIVVVWALVKRPSSASGTEIARDGRFIAYSNGTVLDTRTNLMWAAKDNGSDIDWPGAKRYCENYRGGGYSDWRMPTQDELAGLYDRQKSYKATQRGYDVHLTELIQLSVCCPWASETRGSDAAYFNFFFGDRRWDPQSRALTRALPVRSGK